MRLEFYFEESIFVCRVLSKRKNSYLIFLHCGVVHQPNVVMDVEAEQRPWKRGDTSDWIMKKLNCKSFTGEMSPSSFFRKTVTAGHVWCDAECCKQTRAVHSTQTQEEMCWQERITLTRLPSGFGDNEVVKAVVLKEKRNSHLLTRRKLILTEMMSLSCQWKTVMNSERADQQKL